MAGFLPRLECSEATRAAAEALHANEKNEKALMAYMEATAAYRLNLTEENEARLKAARKARAEAAVSVAEASAACTLWTHKVRAEIAAKGGVDVDESAHLAQKLEEHMNAYEDEADEVEAGAEAGAEADRAGD